MERYSKEEVERLKETYQEGTKIELLFMRDDRAPESGTIGVVRCVDDMGTIHMDWENGSRLGLIEGEDLFLVIRE